MDYLELQQRANQIVSKVNNYEAGLAKYEITEADILAEHKYADLYTLRAVMNLLFGSTVDQKCDRSLNTPTDLRLFASTVPMWNTTFNLIPRLVSNQATYTGFNKILTSTLGWSSSYSPTRLPGQDSTYRVQDKDKPGVLKEAVVAILFTNTQGGEILIDDQSGIYLSAGNNGELHAWNTVTSSVENITSGLDTSGSVWYYIKMTRNDISDTQSRIDYYLSTDLGLTYSLLKSITQNKFDGSTTEGCMIMDDFRGSSNYFRGYWDATKTYLIFDNDEAKKYYMYGEFKELGLYHALTSTGSVSVDASGIASNFSTSNYLKIETANYDTYSTWDLSNMVDPTVELEFTLTSEVNGWTRLLDIHGLIEIIIPNMNSVGTWNWGLNSLTTIINGPLELNKTYRLKVAISNSNTRISTYNYNFTTGQYEATNENLTYSKSDAINPIVIGAYYTGETPFTQGNINLLNTKINNIPMFYTREATVVDYEVKSDKHEFISDIDALNNYNLIHLDALENTVTSRDQRIKHGINYSYSSNIADALVTESQVANMFKWNTTDPNTIPNNTMTLNRQVPGIVVYTIGPDYDKFYTSTIGYNPTTSKFNAVNYGNPSTYGSYYRNDDVKYSQYSHETPTFASEFASCKIFMTGMNYTRGKLESPQQIWQPAEKYGDDNIGYGYNRQGQATYHELVFKNRRKGSGANNVDFTPARSDIPDNDPQGLALRSVLAQQRDFYNGRPWFKELDVLYGANMSKFAANINQSSKLGSGTGSFDRGKFNIVGSPTLSDTGILSNFDFVNYVTVDLPPINTNSEVEITIPKFNLNSTSGGLVGDEVILLFGFPKTTESEGVQFYIHEITSSEYGIGITNGSAHNNIITNNSISNLTKFKISNNILYQEVTGEWLSMGSLNADKTLSTTLMIGKCSDDTHGSATIDLSPLRIVVDGVEVFTAKATGEIYMTDQDFYTNYKLSYDTYAESLNQPK